MDRKTLTISLLSMTAGLLLGANFFATQSAQAMVAVKDRDYTLITARTQSSGDALYVVDNRTGLMAVFAYDPAAKVMRARAVRAVGDAFRQ